MEHKSLSKGNIQNIFMCRYIYNFKTAIIKILQKAIKNTFKTEKKASGKKL